MLRQFTVACLATLLALNVVAHRATAKPPDLPDDDPILVTVPEPSAVLSEAYLLTLDPLTESCCEEEPEAISRTPMSETACPCRSTPDRRVRTADDLKGMPSVLDNLRALQKAADEIDRARTLGAAGKMTEALEHLDKARKLCPGSSYARRADEVLEELLEGKTASGAAEEQEEPACCPDGCCSQLTRFQNTGACYLARLGSYCAKIHDVAARPIDMQFAQTPLASVVQQVSDLLGVPVILDPVALQKRGLSAQLPITIHVEKMPVMAALDLVCRPIGLEARACGDAICITSRLVPRGGKGCPCVGSEEACESAPPKCETKQKFELKIGIGVNFNGGLVGSIVLNERNFDGKKGCCTGEEACECTTACSKCEKMHQAVMKKANQKVAGVKEQVDGLMKACYFAVREGRNTKAADLARQAHALDSGRVEADPLVYKLHLTGELGQCEECEVPRESHPACPNCPTSAGEENLSLRPALPAVDPQIVPALDRLLVTRVLDDNGVERIGIDFETISAKQVSYETKASCCPCCEVASAVGRASLGMLLALPPIDFDDGCFLVGLTSNGINGSSLAKYAGMKILFQHHCGLRLIKVQTAAKPTVAPNE